MPDWTKSMEQTYEFYEVAPGSWNEIAPIRTITSARVSRDLGQETLGSASLTSTEDLGEKYVRFYLVTRQNGIKERFCLGTFLTQTPEYSFNGRVSELNIDCYTPLLELKDTIPPLGYTVFKGTKTMEQAYDIIHDNCRAPVPLLQNETHTLVQDFVSDTSDTWLSFVTDLIANAEYQFELDEDSSILFKKTEDIKTVRPIFRFTDDNSSLLTPDIKDKRDLYGIPNVLEMVYTADNDEYYYALVENNDANSEISIPNRGRRVVRRISNPSFPGTPSEYEFQEYARQQLKQLSTLEHTVTFTHGFIPKVKLGSCVLLNYQRANLNNVRAKITSQSIDCKTGCTVQATATYTTELWNGGDEGV